MSELAGKDRIIKIGTTSSGTDTSINGVDDNTYNTLCDLLDISQFGGSYKKRLAGLLDVDINISGNYDATDTNGQLVCVPGNTVWVKVLPAGVSGKRIKMIVENFEHKAGVGDKQTFSAAFKCMGEEPVTY